MDALAIRDGLRLLSVRHLIVRLADGTSHRLTYVGQAHVTRMDFQLGVDFNADGMATRSLLLRPEDVAGIDVIEPVDRVEGRRPLLPPG